MHMLIYVCMHMHIFHATYLIRVKKIKLTMLGHRDDFVITHRCSKSRVHRRQPQGQRSHWHYLDQTLL